MTIKKDGAIRPFLFVIIFYGLLYTPNKYCITN